MMKFEDLVKQRRSIRKYSKRIPKDEVIEKILAAGTWAPSGLNNQPWKFKLVQEKAKKQGLAEFTKYSRVIEQAPLAICVFLDNTATYNRVKDIQAIGACIQNILLQADQLGLGACWLGEILNRSQEVEKYLEIDDDYELMAVITLGYPDQQLTKGCRKKLKSFIL
ncbi:nitroreductase family protein [Candidatus Omnitrophota bacterium]